MKIVLSVCLVLLVSLFPGLSLAESGDSDSWAVAQYVNDISLATN